MLHLSTRQKVTIARLLNRTIRLARSILHKPMQGEFTRNRLRWLLDLNEGIDLAIYLFGAFERDLVRCYSKQINAGATVLDIGANIGAHTLPLARATGPTGRVIAVEATSYAIGKLRTNLSLNPELQFRVAPVHALLVANSADSAESHIYSSWPLNDQGTTHPVLSGALKSVGAARICTVDQLVTEMSLPSVDFVKLDVDGHELSVLRGAAKTVEAYHPRIIMEMAPYCHADKPGQFEALVDWLGAAGYHFTHVETGRPLPSTASKLIKHIPQGGSINVLCAQFA
jgi:FkbM family methyltransferase